MQVLQVFDPSLAEKLRESGWAEIKTQYGIEPAVWTFHYDESKPLCFDIKDVSLRGKCALTGKLVMRF